MKFPGHELSLAELTAAVLDGDLTAVGEGFSPTDAPETAWLRAKSLEPVLGTTLAATHTLAAWVWGAVSEQPGVLTTQRATPTRIHVTPRRRVTYRDGYVGEDDLEWFSGVAVTSLGRTLADLARIRDLRVVAQVAAMFPEAVVDAHNWCSQRAHFPGARAAIGLLATYLVPRS